MTLTTVCTSTRLSDIYEHLRTVNVNRQYENVGLSFFTENTLKYCIQKKNVTAIKKHCHQNEHRCSVDYFETVGNDVNDFDFQLKESLLVFKIKPCLKIR